MARHLRTHLLIGLPLAVTLLLGAASVYSSYVLFPPHFSGWGELTPTRTISGWVVRRTNDDAGPVEVQLYLNGAFVAHATANLPRPDVAEAGWTKEARCGYSFPLPTLPAGEHQARVYAVHRVANGAYVTLQATGHPLRLRVEQDGTVRRAN